jgi:outer membrane receptor protein involved in Fe transport
VAGAGEQVVIVDEERNKEIELGADAERRLAKDLTGKAIVLFFRQVEDPVSTQTSFDSTGVLQQLRRASTDNQATEGIARVEFDWSGIPNHALQLNLEGAYNELDGSLLQVVDRGAGAVVVDVPGANSVVEEVRGDFLLKDTWTLGQFELDYGLGAESSTISQRGDAELERDFFFVKPHVVLSHAPGQGKQTRLRVAREVAQLDFEDFISATVYEDDDLALGNPNLRPDSTWVAEVGHERRYGELGVVKLTLFHHWIRDVLDLLPLSESFEAPGNIGDGRRWGVELENTVPLEWLGLTGARLDVKLRWQDSSVTDPVTGQSRRLSGGSGFGGTPYIDFRDENEYAFIADYRQDLEEARVAWGVNMGMRAKRPLYKVNELDVYDEGISLNAFVETTRWFGLKLRFQAENMPNLSQRRDRISYAGLRDLSAVDFREISVGREGVRLTFLTSGSF